MAESRRFGIMAGGEWQHAEGYRRVVADIDVILRQKWMAVQRMASSDYDPSIELCNTCYCTIVDCECEVGGNV